MVRDQNPLVGNPSMLAAMLSGSMGGGAGGMSPGYSDAMSIPLAATRQTFGEDKDTVNAMRAAIMHQQADMMSQMAPGGSTTPPSIDAISTLQPGSPGFDPMPGAGGGPAGMLGLNQSQPMDTGGATAGGGGMDSLLALLGGGSMAPGGMPGQGPMMPGPDQEESSEPEDLMSLLGGGRMPQQPGMQSLPPTMPQPGTTPNPTRRPF